MAYNDYGAFVRRNGERMESHEDAVLERLDGGSGGQAVFDHLAQGSGGDLYHAVLGDGEWRLGEYKTTFPYLWHHERVRIACPGAEVCSTSPLTAPGYGKARRSDAA